MSTALGETYSTGRVWAISEDERPQNMGWLVFMGASLIPQLVKNPHAMQGTLVRILGQEDPLEKG